VFLYAVKIHAATCKVKFAHLEGNRTLIQLFYTVKRDENLIIRAASNFEVDKKLLIHGLAENTTYEESSIVPVALNITTSEKAIPFTVDPGFALIFRFEILGTNKDNSELAF